MTKIDRWLGAHRPVMAPEGLGTGGGEGGEGEGEGTGDKSPASILYPDDNKPEGEGDAKTPAGDDKPADGDWKEYENDPNKSDEENAQAKAEHDKTKPADPNAPENQVPADGKYALTMPEGVEVDQGLLDALTPRLIAKGFTQKEAQELAEDFIKHKQGELEAQGKQWGERVAGWAEDAKKDAEIGGTNWNATVTTSRRAIDRLGTPALKEYLEATGGGNHPELIRFMAKVGAMIKEDAPPSGGTEGRGKPAEAAHLLYPNDAPKG